MWVIIDKKLLFVMRKKQKNNEKAVDQYKEIMYYMNINKDCWIVTGKAGYTIL